MRKICLSPLIFLLLGCDKVEYKRITLKGVVTQGIKNPECVFYDKSSDSLFVSHVNGATTAIDSNGYISQLSLSGKVLNSKVLDGLNAPKGIYVADGILYVTDINRIILHDLNKKGRDTIIEVKGATSLNDIVYAESNKLIYASDLHGNKVYILGEKEAEISVEKPNGLFLYGESLYIGTFHKDGKIYKMSLEDPSYALDLYMSKCGPVDGLYIDDTLIVVSNFSNSLDIIEKKSRDTVAYARSNGKVNYGDFYFSGQMIVSPSMKSNEIFFLKLE
mgnify:CR=1 FL=1